MQDNNLPIIIIGAGLSGLSLAYFLQERGLSANVLEARQRPGGRILTSFKAQQAPIEMGATWLGNKHTALVELLASFGIGKYEQYQNGLAIYESQPTAPAQLIRLPHNPEPSYRIDGSSSRLVEHLTKVIPASQIKYEQLVQKVEKTANGLLVHTQNQSWKASIVVSTLPPNLLVKTVELPDLPEEVYEIAARTHTWMGESIKFGLRFKEAFWRKPQTSGTIFSNVGPIIECHDHTDPSGQYFGLKGFLHPSTYRFDFENRKQQVFQQLRKFYGAVIDDYLDYEDRVWRAESFTYHPYDTEPIPHQNNGHPIFRQAFLEGRFYISGSETASQFPGYMDGAVRAARWISKSIFSTIQKQQIST